MLAAALCLIAQAPDPPFTPAPREFRAVWIATVDNIDWPSKRTLTTEQQQREFLRILDKAQALNLNAVILQVRPSCDALYDSKIEPWSEFLTNIQGRAPYPYYDPLAFAVQEAHRRGLELHAWFNPYRAKHPSAKGPLAPNHIQNTKPGLAKTYGSYLWLDPGEPEVQKRSLDVILDVVKRYDIDGVHLDDYFYPYPVKGPDGKYLRFPDQDSYARYQQKGGTLGLSDWRRSNVDGFIARLYKGVKRTKKWVKVGISPFGIYRPGVPETIKAGIDQYEALSADCLKWFKEGWCDYLTPQLYWPIKQTAQSYPVLLSWWAGQNPKRRHLWPGNFTGKVRAEDGHWPPQEVLDQIEITRKTPGATGNVHFSMKVFLEDAQGLDEQLLAGPYREKALVPASPWLGHEPLGAPKKLSISNVNLNPFLTWEPGAFDSASRFAAVYDIEQGKWRLRAIVPVSDRSASPAMPDGTTLAVTAIDRYGNESKPAFVPPLRAVR